MDKTPGMSFESQTPVGKIWRAVNSRYAQVRCRGILLCLSHRSTGNTTTPEQCAVI